MPPLAGQQIFAVGGASYTWEDVVLAACVWGDWPALQARVRDGLACLARLEDLDEDDEDALDEAEVEAAADEFRYARDLIAASDLEQWLQARGLTVDGWLDVIRRRLLRERWAERLHAIREQYEVADEAIAAATDAEAVCTGLAADLVRRLAARAALHGRLDPTVIVKHEPPLTRETEDAIARALVALSPRVRHERLAVLAQLEASWRRFTAETAPAATVQSVVAARRLDWVRLTTATVIAPDDDVAHELALCVRDDRRSLEEVAADAGLAVRTAEVWLEDVEEALRDALMVAQPGETLGPLATPEGAAVVVVSRKQPPSLEDPAVRARAEEALLARAVDRAITDHVIWHVTL